MDVYISVLKLPFDLFFLFLMVTPLYLHITLTLRGENILPHFLFCSFHVALLFFNLFFEV